MKNGTASTYVQNDALKTFIHLNGPVAYLHQLFKAVIPTGEDFREQTLLDYIITHPDEEFEVILIDKFTSSTVLKHQLNYARHLLQLSNLDGLRFLVDYTKKERKSPFDDYSSLNFPFENPKGIWLLLQLLNFGHDNSIEQDFLEA